MRVLITGGAGFIGSSLCRWLVGRDWVGGIAVLDDLSTGLQSNLDGVEGVAFTEGSILDGDLVVSLMAKADAVVHLAARPSVPRSIQDPIASHCINVDGTLNVLEAARQGETPTHVIFASSSSVYGRNAVLPKREDSVALPLSPYAASKLAGEQYLLAYQESFGVPALAFRFFNVFGPRQLPGHAYAAVIPAFVHAALNDQPLVVHGDGHQTRDFTFVDTVCEIIGSALDRRVTSELPVNLAYGSRTSLLELIGELERQIGVSLDRQHVDHRRGDVRDSQSDPTRLTALFPDVVPTDLAYGLKSTIDWMRATVGS